MDEIVVPSGYYKNCTVTWCCHHENRNDGEFNLDFCDDGKCHSLRKKLIKENNDTML